MIQPGSRYANSTIGVVVVNGQARQVINPSQQEPYTFTYTSYQITAGDRIDTISSAFYGDPAKWYCIADANPAVMDWSVLSVGSIILIPNI